MPACSALGGSAVGVGGFQLHVYSTCVCMCFNLWMHCACTAHTLTMRCVGPNFHGMPSAVLAVKYTVNSRSVRGMQITRDACFSYARDACFSYARDTCFSYAAQAASNKNHILAAAASTASSGLTIRCFNFVSTVLPCCTVPPYPVAWEVECKSGAL